MDMVKKHNWLVVIVSCIFLLVTPTASAESESNRTIERDQAMGERYGDVDDSWASSDIEKLLNVYGPTSAGNSSNKATNKLPYEEMGVYGVEYENIFIYQYSKEPAPTLQNIDTKSDNAGVDKAPSK